MCDSADSSDAKPLRRAGSPLTGVLHAAGSGGSGLIRSLEVGRVRLMSAPKAFGSHHLHCATSGAPLEVQLHFSSVGAGLGNLGQASYAAANASLDAGARLVSSCGGVTPAVVALRRLH